VIAVAVVSSSPMARARLESLVAAQPRVRLASGSSPLATGDHGASARAGPDVLLMDPGARAPETVLRTLPPAARVSPVVVVGVDAAPGALPRLLRAGVRALLPRDVSATELAACIEAVAAGLVVLHPSGLPFAGVRTRHARRVPDAAGTAPLTPRELEVLAMMAEGMGNRAIAQRLRISIHTVKFHIAAILTKLHARSRTEAVTAGLRQGVLMV
jgi:two-component system, NarL family, response regulator YdfI